MPSSNPYVLGAHATPGTTRTNIERIELADGTFYEIPVTLIAGAHDGPTFVAVAGVHAGEYPGIVALANLSHSIDPANLSGTVLFVPCLNTSGLWERREDVVAQDGVDINKALPGKADGTPGERIAHWVATQLLPGTIYVLDLHSGAQYEALTNHAWIPVVEPARTKAFEAARTLDVPYLVDTSNRLGISGYAAFYLDTPGMLYEIGQAGECRNEWVEHDETVVLQLLDHFGMYKSTQGAPSNLDQIAFTKVDYVTANERGLWRPSITAGQHVETGDELGRMLDFFGNELAVYHASEPGIVLYHGLALAMSEGSLLAAYGLKSAIEQI